mmetsp:Transcript_139097/g.253121  ORF Transcript_139097/g.253121 Transcript_139097/m.253121 type:complete len:89 (-) Transcript_139097:7-273(-)
MRAQCVCRPTTMQGSTVSAAVVLVERAFGGGMCLTRFLTTNMLCILVVMLLLAPSGVVGHIRAPLARLLLRQIQGLTFIEVVKQNQLT